MVVVNVFDNNGQRNRFSDKRGEVSFCPPSPFAARGAAASPMDAAAFA